jgi:hypothetical protein
MTRHPLIGRILRWSSDDEDGKPFVTVSRFTEDLGNGYFLAMRLCVSHGEDLGRSYIVSLEALDVPEGVEIYDSWEALSEAEARLLESDDDEDRVAPKLGHVH